MLADENKADEHKQRFVILFGAIIIEKVSENGYVLISKEKVSGVLTIRRKIELVSITQDRVDKLDKNRS